jgi:hypothetical protein
VKTSHGSQREERNWRRIVKVRGKVVAHTTAARLNNENASKNAVNIYSIPLLQRIQCKKTTDSC